MGCKSIVLLIVILGIFTAYCVLAGGPLENYSLSNYDASGTTIYLGLKTPGPSGTTKFAWAIKAIDTTNGNSRITFIWSGSSEWACETYDSTWADRASNRPGGVSPFRIFNEVF